MSNWKELHFQVYRDRHEAQRREVSVAGIALRQTRHLRTTVGKILSMKCLTLQMCDINQRPVLLYCWYCRARWRRFIIFFRFSRDQESRAGLACRLVPLSPGALVQVFSWWFCNRWRNLDLFFSCYTCSFGGWKSSDWGDRVDYWLRFLSLSTLSSSDRQNWPCKRKITGIGVISIDPVPNFQCSTKRRFTCLIFFFPLSCTCSLGCVKSCCKGLTQPAGDSLGMRIDDMTLAFCLFLYCWSVTYVW